MYTIWAHISFIFCFYLTSFIDTFSVYVNGRALQLITVLALFFEWIVSGWRVFVLKVNIWRHFVLIVMRDD